jgi:hypothetical protein
MLRLLLSLLQQPLARYDHLWTPHTPHQSLEEPLNLPYTLALCPSCPLGLPLAPRPIFIFDWLKIDRNALEPPLVLTHRLTDLSRTFHEPPKLVRLV